MIDRQQVNLRLERELVDSLDELAQDAHVDRTEVARRILTDGIARARMERAVRDYGSGRASAWKAARAAGVSLYELLDAIHEAGIPYELDPEDLASTPAATRAGSRRVAEGPAPYGTDISSAKSSDIAELRENYRPTTVRMLFVGESSPAGGTHFYLANSNLYRATRAAFAAALGPDTVPDGESFLAWFRDRGCWIVDISDVPMNHLSDPERRAAIERGVEPLGAVIGQTKPNRIVVVKRDIEEPVAAAMRLAGVEVPFTTLPFPVRQWRPVYEQGLADLLRAGERDLLGLAGTIAVPTDPSGVAWPDVLTETHRERGSRRRAH
jgi:predicted HTH domain antitoxin